MDTLKEQIYQLEQKLLQPEVRMAPEEIDQLLAEDFMEFGSSGNVWVKADCVQPGGLSVRQMTIQDFDIRLLAENVVLATYLVYDESRNEYTLRSSIWKHLNGRWQMTFHQGTKTCR